MAFMRGMDFFGQPIVKGYLTNTPPGSPSDGDSYIIGAAPTGAWAGQGGKIARYSTVAAAWEFYTPQNGWMVQANSAREIYRRTGGVWEIYYQEGTWTPTLYGETTVGTTVYTYRTGTYTKVGRQVFAEVSVAISSKTGTGTALIGGFPFSINGSVSGCSIAFYSGVSIAGKMLGLMPGGTVFFRLYDNPGSFLDMSSVSASADIRFSASVFL
jgi:hypothetical protein